MSDKPDIPLSRLRELHQQAKAYYVNWGDSLPDIFRRYVRAEIQERTVEALQAELDALRAERDQWQQRAEGAVYALMLTEPHMLRGNMTEWIANCAQMIEAQGRRLAELERAVQWEPVKEWNSLLCDCGCGASIENHPSGIQAINDIGVRVGVKLEASKYRLCRRITQEGVDDATSN